MDIEILLKPVEGDNPSGTELRHDARFHAIERLLESADKKVRVTPEGAFSASAPPVAWDQILTDGMALAEDGRDLRLLVILVRAAFAANGFQGLATGLDMLSQTLETFWDSLHPELRDRDSAKAAATPRINALRQLENDDNGLLGDMKFGAILTPKGIGPIMGYDLSVGTYTEHEMQAKAVSGLSQAELAEIGAAHGQRLNRVRAGTAALAAEEPERAQAMLDGITACETAITTLCEKLSEVGGFGDETGLTLPEITEFLQLVRATLVKAMSQTGDATETPTTADEAPSGAAPAPATVSTPGSIATRKDVEKMLDGIIAFYEKSEPSSPIPHLARRMRRMVPMNFLQLMEEVAPSGMKEFRNVAGVEDAAKK